MPDIHSLGSTSGILPCTPVWCGYDYPTQRDRDTFQHTSVSELTNRFLHRCAVADEGLRTQDAGGAVRGRDSDNPAQPPCQPGPRLKEDGTRRTERRMSPATLSRGSGRARIGFTRGLSKKNTHTGKKIPGDPESTLWSCTRRRAPPWQLPSSKRMQRAKPMAQSLRRDPVCTDGLILGLRSARAGVRAGAKMCVDVGQAF